MIRVRTAFAPLGFALVALTPGCSSGGSGGGNGGGNGDLTCPAGYDAGPSVAGTEAVSESGQCANLLTGTTAAGGACQQSADCLPTCCACPNANLGAEVASCSGGKCVGGVAACCAWIAGASVDGSDAGVPYECKN